MALKVPQRTNPETTTSNTPDPNYQAGIELLQKLSNELEGFKENLKGQNMEIRLFSENLQIKYPKSNFPPSLQVFLLDDRKEEPFFAALSPSIRFSLNEKNQIASTIKTSRGLTSGMTESQVTLENPVVSYSLLEEQVNTFLNEAAKSLDHGPH